MEKGTPVGVVYRARGPALDRCAGCPSSDWSPPRVYPLVPLPIAPRPGYILLSLLRLAQMGGPASRGLLDCCARLKLPQLMFPFRDWCPLR
eukprot:6716549-Pyramimonas_sp.AAC.1